MVNQGRQFFTLGKMGRIKPWAAVSLGQSVQPPALDNGHPPTARVFSRGGSCGKKWEGPRLTTDWRRPRRTVSCKEALGIVECVLAISPSSLAASWAIGVAAVSWGRNCHP
jgi:hypothetical protein